VFEVAAADRAHLAGTAIGVDIASGYPLNLGEVFEFDGDEPSELASLIQQLARVLHAVR
jgi:hypothetical protein